MIQITINQQLENINTNVVLTELLDNKGISHNSVALVVNQRIIPRSQWHEYVCQPNDNIEFFSAVAGG
ncbi:sulfur carrier protein ThiS [Shewanella gaetbuli]|uniref:Sulfur carrier protein ThiS n=1 Tax=Shewanella gaetbuli TaxID=220752 RepID=A0A9X1ZKE3_9GAMM|nr:sulfur carrier protein ThiS [Shewanella gaetbuli]MCL1143156.1 sulfur carrier protein ThiS [Shewanella gaetbuli]